ncbi:MAG: hypothetical protein E6837_02685 [Staphylococcus epidermidis]|nr:hypothetical protein [Staphylococcus epidermidis]
MAIQFVINLLVSVIWLLVTNSYTLNNFVFSIDFSTKEEEIQNIKSSLEKVVRKVGEK